MFNCSELWKHSRFRLQGVRRGGLFHETCVELAKHATDGALKACVSSKSASAGYMLKPGVGG